LFDDLLLGIPNPVDIIPFGGKKSTSNARIAGFAGPFLQKHGLR